MQSLYSGVLYRAVQGLMGLVALGLSILITALFRFLAGIIVYVIIGAVVVGQIYPGVECVLLLVTDICRRAVWAAPSRCGYSGTSRSQTWVGKRKATIKDLFLQ